MCADSFEDGQPSTDLSVKSAVGQYAERVVHFPTIYFAIP